MKILTVIRHASAKPAQAKIPDCDRSLSAKSQTEIQALAHTMNQCVDKPIDRALISSATRTQMTAKHLFAQLKIDVLDVHNSTTLYQADLHHLSDVLTSQSDAIDHLLVVGHNPVVTELCFQLLKEPFVLDPACAFGLRLHSQMWADLFHSETTCLFTHQLESSED